MSEAPATLRLDYFDGRSARPQGAEIWIADGRLHLAAALAQQQYPLGQVRWPERQRHGQRQAQLPDGGLLSCADARAWDDWAAASGLRDSVTVRWMQSWRHVGIALLALCLAILAGWRWGVPLAAELALRAVPASAERQLGERTLGYLDEYLLKPSGLSAAQQRQIAERFAAALGAGANAAQPQPAYRLHFRRAEPLGPNAFALPGGDIVLTDALVELMRDEPDAVVGVLAHELGHVRHHHGLRITVQAGIVGIAAAAIIGDFSSVLAGAPALLAQQSYSRDFEREADAYARQTLRQAGLSPRVMVGFFERIADYRQQKTEQQQQQRGADPFPLAFSSHPADAERIRFFSE
ncbi:MAG: M48 family metallopeptidase [Burkholderiaceae bacterium]